MFVDTSTTFQTTTITSSSVGVETVTSYITSTAFVKRTIYHAPELTRPPSLSHRQLPPSFEKNISPRRLDGTRSKLEKMGLLPKRQITSWFTDWIFDWQTETSVISSTTTVMVGGTSIVFKTSILTSNVVVGATSTTSVISTLVITSTSATVSIVTTETVTGEAISTYSPIQSDSQASVPITDTGSTSHNVPGPGQPVTASTTLRSTNSKTSSPTSSSTDSNGSNIQDNNNNPMSGRRKEGLRHSLEPEGRDLPRYGGASPNQIQGGMMLPEKAHTQPELLSR